MNNSAQKKSDRRQFGRLRTRFHAWAISAGRPRVACIVHNLSVSGALIEVTDGAVVPATFTLAIEAASINVACDVRHRNGQTMGVEFRSPVNLAGLSGFTPVGATATAAVTR